uniref:Uncharacterized protein n=1 Tax=Brassica oleracea var. oleracea TaxID=109376 RepID=A0A0D3DN76_BRAOL
MNAEVCSVEWKFINMSEQEEDLILRMYRLVGDRKSTGKKSSGDREILDREKEHTHLPSIFQI